MMDTPVADLPTAVTNAAASEVLAGCWRLSWTDFPGLYAYAARGRRDIAGVDRATLVHGIGISTDPGIASLAAVSEAIERYCALRRPDPGRLVRAAFRELWERGLNPINPASLALHSEAQYRRTLPLQRLTIDKRIDWFPAASLTRHSSMLVPAGLVSFAVAGTPPNDFLAELSTTGLACHLTSADAIFHGLCEVVERDALAIAWHTRLPLAPVDLPETPVGRLLQPGLVSGVELALYRVPTDLPLPVMFCVGWREEGKPHAVTGCGAHPDPSRAADKALLEVVQMLHSLSRRRGVGSPPRVRQLSDHGLFYATREGASLLRQQLVIGPRYAERGCSLASGESGAPRPLAQVVSALGRLGLEVLAADITADAVGTTGFHAARVLVPGLLDVAGDARLPRLGCRRLYEVPARLGFRRTNEVSRFNLLPIPLA